MNLFFLDLNAKLCAAYHCDKHCVKMILEACQMMWAAFHATGKGDWIESVPAGIKVYKLTHKNHPTSIWVRSSQANFIWTATLAKELCLEYTRRYKKRHACQNMIEWFLENVPECNEKEEAKDTTYYCSTSIPKGCTPPPLAMPEQHQTSDLIESYREYYVYEKAEIVCWNRGPTPDWFVDDFTELLG